MSKQALVLLPGFLCDQTYWQAQIDALSDIADCTCAQYGTLDAIPNMAESVLHSAPDRFAVAGHSMGGRIAFEIYRQAPRRIERLAVFNTGTAARSSGPTGQQEETNRRRLLALARSDGMRTMALQWVQAMVAPPRLQDRGLIESIVSMFERKSPDLFEAQMNALLDRPDATPLLAQIRCPTLVVTGREDAWSPPLTHQMIAGGIAGAQLVIVPDSGHMSAMEQPAAVSQAMREWLGQGIGYNIGQT
jgi:pimeloyl-ACP methyl ester carboxylesterase